MHDYRDIPSLFYRSASLSPDAVTCLPEDPDHLVLPFFVIRFLVIFDAALPKPDKERIFGTEGTDILDPPRPPAPVVEDQEPPAAVVAADLRPCQVNGTVCLLAPGAVAEERAGMRKLFKNALIIKEFPLVRVDSYRGLLSGIRIADQETVLPVLFLYDVNPAEVAAAVPALETLEGQNPPRYRMLCQIASTNSRAMRMMMTHSRKLECWILTSSESIE